MASSNQNGFRKSLLFYLKENANPKLLFKLMKASKYFCFKEFPFSVIQDIEHRQEERYISTFNSDGSVSSTRIENMNIDEISKHLWVTDYISIDFKETNIASRFISKMVFCNVSRLYLHNQQISVDELKFLVNDNLEDVHLSDTVVKDLNGKPLLLEKVLQLFVKVRIFLFNFRYDFSSQFNSDSTKNIIEVLKQSKIQRFSLFKVPEMLDIDALFKFMKENPQIRYCLQYRHIALSGAYRQKLQAIIDEVYVPGTFGGPIMVSFRGQILKQSNLHELRFG